MKHSFKERFAYWFDTQMARGSVALIRLLALVNSFVFLGYQRAETYESFFNPRLDEEIELNADDSLIVLAEN